MRILNTDLFIVIILCISTRHIRGTGKTNRILSVRYTYGAVVLISAAWLLWTAGELLPHILSDEN